MTADRVEPFQIALTNLRERLRDGALAAGERLAAADIAAELNLSATPVREALSRLAGEGLLEDRRGMGFFVRTLTAVDIADLFRLNLELLLLAHDPHREDLRAPTEAPEVGGRTTDPIREVERVFAGWMAETGSRTLIIAYRAGVLQLGPVRRAEPLLFDDLVAEAAEICSLAFRDSSGRWNTAVRHFHDRRIAVADRLAALVGRST